MPLLPPALDSRTFKDLVDEAKARLPRYTPEWTNFNDSDPGMALVQLHAWLTETILYDLNRIPDRNYLAFLDLLGIIPEPAHPARTDLTFTLKDPPGVTVSVPRLTKVAVDDPAAPSDLVFETDRTLLALDAAIGAALVPRAQGGAVARTRDLLTRFDKGQTTWAYSFDPFGAGTGSALYLGLRLRPGREKTAEAFSEDRFPAGPMDLYADAVRILDRGAGPDAAVIQGPVPRLCPPPGTAGLPLDHVVWHVFTGTGDEPALFQDDAATAGWTRLRLTEDGTQALSGSGHLVFEMPATMTALDPARLPAEVWASFGATRPPRSKAELAQQLREGPLDILDGLGEFWVRMGATEAEEDQIAACGEDPVAVADVIMTPDPDPEDEADSTPVPFQLDPTALTLKDWIKVNEGYAAPLPQNDRGYLPLYWLRARLDGLPVTAAAPSTIRAFHLNTVPATQASTRLDDRLGRLNGRPAQVFRLPKVPVLIDPATGAPDLALEIAEDGQDPVWRRVDDFYLSGPGDAHFMLDPATGEVRLGDGRRGRIPVAGATVTATRYRVGGGAVGNAGAGQVTKLRGGLRHVKGVTNLRAAHDGSDAETLEAVRLRAPSDLRSRDRAVTAADFADLALRTPGVALHKAVALARRAPAPDGFVDRDGAVTLVVLPRIDQPRPQPTEEQKRAICRWLEPRRLITTELHITGPHYATVTELRARLTVARDRDLGEVTGAVVTALADFLSPLSGGEDGTGWPFGAAIYYADLYERMLAVPGVRRASGLSVRIDGVAGDTVADVAAIPDGTLLALARDTVDLVAAYE